MLNSSVCCVVNCCVVNVANCCFDVASWTAEMLNRQTSRIFDRRNQNFEFSSMGKRRRRRPSSME